MENLAVTKENEEKPNRNYAIIWNDIFSESSFKF